MITLSDYFGPYDDHSDATTERREAADDLLSKVNQLLFEAEQAGVYEWEINPNTGTNISGTQNGGFRPRACPVGSRNSSHKEGRGVDVYDPQNKVDAWITDERLELAGLYREAPDATIGWVHLTDRAPPSKNRTFQP